MLVRYDLHCHTALSPCADNQMTPNQICAMARVANLDFLAITDHCSAKNVRAVYNANQAMNEKGKRPLIIVPGMELTTQENIHVLCLFSSLEQCEEFGSFVLERMVASTKLYGDQLIFNRFDEIVGVETQNLLEVSSIKYTEVENTVARFNGVAVPAHIDRQYSGVLWELGWVGWNGGSVEVKYDSEDLYNAFPDLKCYRHLVSSDAHELGMIGMRGGELEIEQNTLVSFLSTINAFPAKGKGFN